MSRSRTPAGDAVTDLVRPVFELNAEFLAVAEDLTAPVGLTPARWQVLAATIEEPLPVAEIARRVGLGLARQSVQRVADLLVGEGWAEYAPNPHHRRAKLLAPTDRGRSAAAELRDAQHAWADAVGAEIGAEELQRIAEGVRRAVAVTRALRAR